MARNVTGDAVRRSGLPVGAALAMIRKDIQELRRQTSRPHPGPADFEQRLHEIATQIDALQKSAPSRGETGSSMEEFLVELKALLAQNETRLAALQLQVATSAAVAISGPAETIRRDVASLKEIQASVDRRTQDTFEAVYGTIERIVDRLAAIEGELRDRPAAPASAALERRAVSAARLQPGREVPALAPAEGARMRAMLRQPALPDVVPDTPVEPDSVPTQISAVPRRLVQMAARLAATARQTLGGASPGGIRRETLTPQGKLAVLGVGGGLLMLFAVTFLLDFYRRAPAVVSDSLPPGTEERAAIDPERPDDETARTAELSPSPNQIVRQESDQGYGFNPPLSPFSADANPPADSAAPGPAAGGPIEMAAAAMPGPGDAKQDADVSPLMRNALFPAPAGTDPWSPPSSAAADLTAAPLPPEIGSKTLIDAASAGDPGASHEIAIRFAQGRVGGAPNFEMAAAWLDRAARAGVAPAQFRLGGLYEKGLGVRKDPEEARHLYMAAAAKGHAKAMHNLAVLYAGGIDGAPDYAAAAGWFRKAAGYGTVDSQYNLGILYARGSGVERDFVESYKWFTLAIKGGDRDAVHKRDEVAKALDPKQLESARQAADAFVAKRQPEEATTTRAPAGGWDEVAATATTKSKPPSRLERSPSR